MGRRYDVIDRLRNRNERPVVEIDAEHKYPINTSKTNVLLIMSEVKKAQKKTEDDPESDIKMIDKIIQIALGKEALDYINESNMTMAATNDIMAVIMAAIGDTEVDFDDGETPEEKKVDRWYDIFEDWELVESSFAMQYPTKDLYDDKMDWIEFTTLLAGIMPDTPLGNVISIRAEDDADTLEHFSEEQHRIRDEWRDKQTQRMIESMNKEEVMKEVYAMFMDMSK